ncbi:phage integrase family protein [Cupriavidus necator]
MWQRYLAEQGEFQEHVVHRMTGWIRGELMAAAARAGNLGRVHLLRLHLAPLEADALPSLATFIAEHDLDGFAEAEQQAMYDEHYRADLDVQRRRARLLRRQLWAIHLAEAQLAQPVSPGDACRVWFVDTLAARLAGAGIVTLGALHARMSASPVWWQPLRGIGAGKAQAITQFVGAHADTLGALPDWPPPDPPQAAQANLGVAPVVVSPFSPLERLVVPTALSGRTGRFRAPRDGCLLDADDDVAAIHAWIAAKAPAQPSLAGEKLRLSATQLAYQKEAERFLLWAVLENRTALSSVTVEDCVRFRDFLLKPPPAWCGPRAVPRWRADWRPLAGPLSARSVGYALSLLNNLFGFLVQQGYLRANPWPAVTPPVVTTPGLDTGRALTDAQWQCVREALAGLPPTLANQRLQVALRLLHESAIRLSELLGARTGDLEWRSLAQPPVAPETGWWLTVRGKGGRLRRVPVSDGWLATLGRYLTARGLSADPRLAGDACLLGSAAPDADPTAGVSGSVFHGQLKRFFRLCAERLAATDPPAAARFLRASCHWLRHTAISYALARGAGVEVVQQNAGHASLGTTTRYVQVADARRARAMRGIWESP